MQELSQHIVRYIRKWYSIILIVLGLMGYLLADIVFFKQGFSFSKEKHTSSFQEVTVDRRAIAIAMIDTNIHFLNSNIKPPSKSKSTNKDSIRIFSNSDSISTLYGKWVDTLQAQKFLVGYLSEDSLPKWFSKNIHFNQPFRRDSIEKLSDTSTIYMNFFYDGIKKLPKHIVKQFSTKINAPGNNVAYFAKYPAFGVWVIIMFISFIFWFMLFLIMPTSMYQLHVRVNSLTAINTNKNRIYSTIFLCIVILFIFFLFALLSFYDGRGFNEQLFKHDYATSVYRVITVVGYFASAFCLSGFLLCAFFMYEIMEKNIDFTSEEGKQYRFKLELLNKYFNLYLTIVAILFGLLVFSTGTLFTAYNSLDFIQLVQQESGKPFFSFDLLLLYAGIHSLILLLFYVPVKITRMQIESMYNEDGTTTSDLASSKATVKDTFKNVFTVFKELLLPASPLIAGILQKLLETLFK